MLSIFVVFSFSFICFVLLLYLPGTIDAKELNVAMRYEYWIIFDWFLQAVSWNNMTKICDNRALGFEMNEEVPSLPNFVHELSFSFIYYVLEYHFSQDGYMCGCYIILQNLCLLWNYVLLTCKRHNGAYHFNLDWFHNSHINRSIPAKLFRSRCIS